MTPEFRADLLLAVDQQLLSPETPYVAKTYQRLLALGLDEAAAKYQIVYCLCEEMEQILKTHRSFSEKSYRAALKNLPIALDIENEENENQV